MTRLLPALRTLSRLVLLWCGLALSAWAGPGTVAVLYFENRGQPELEPLKVGLTQMLISDLQPGAGQSYTVVERTRLQEILDELELGHSGVVDPDTAAKVGKLLGAEWLVLGGYFQFGPTFRVDAQLVKVETGVIHFAHGEHGAPEQFIDVEQKLAAAFRGALAEATAASGAPAGAPAPEGASGATGATGAAGSSSGGVEGTGETRASGAPGAAASGGEVRVSGGAAVRVVTPDPDAVDAAVAFSEGLILLDGDDVPRAREAFEQALAKDPNLEEARAQLAALEL